MKRWVIFIVSSWLLTTIVFSQTYFNKEYKTNSSTLNLGGFIHPFVDGSGYLLASTLQESGSFARIRLLRLNMLGDTLWTKIYKNNPPAEWITTGNYINKGDTNFIFISTFASNPNTFDSLLVVLNKIDSSGGVLWHFIFGDSDKGTAPKDIKPTPDGGYIITGWTTGWGNTVGGSAFLLKIDSNGTEQWHQIYPGGVGTLSSEAYSVEVMPDGGYLVAGFIRLQFTQYLNTKVFKTNSTGAVMWSKIYNAPEANGFGWVTDYRNTGDYILVAGVDTATSFTSGFSTATQGYIARISGANGNIVWADTMGVAQIGVLDLFSSNVIVLADGSIIGIGGTHYSITTGLLEAWLVKYDGNGNLLWQRNYSKYGGTSDHTFWDVHPTADGGFILCGDIFNSTVPEKNLWVVKVDSNGCDVANCTVGIEENSLLITHHPLLKVYPNPNNGIFTLQIETPFNQAALTVFNATGKQIIQQNIAQTETQLNLLAYPKGMYFYHLIIEGKLVAGKVVRE